MKRTITSKMMIEKLQPYQSSKSSTDGIHWEYRPNMEDVINKVNEIIDAVNANSLGFSLPIGSVFGGTNNPYKHTKKDEPIKHGHWINNTECSVCGEWEDFQDGYRPYCPNCGAKMDEVE